MKKKIKGLLIFLCGVLLGTLLTCQYMKPKYQPIPNESRVDEIGPNKEDKQNQLSDQKQENDELEEPNTVPTNTWNSETIYTGGDVVIFNGKIYKAKWWTQNEQPGKADVWEDTLISAEETLLPIEEEQPALLPPLTQGKRDNFKVVGYFPSWKENTNTIQYDVLTHINYAFAIPTSEGNLLPLENEQMAKKIIAEAHQNKVKVFIAVGGWSYHEVPLESTFMFATETAEKRTKLINEIVAMCEKYGFDGVDLDWEHPRVDGNSAKQYEAFVVELANTLHQQNKQLSSAVLSGATPDGNIYYDAAAHSNKVLESVDWINVMAYDGGDGERHSSYEFAVNCGKYWHDKRGVSADKVVLGVPFYARPSWAAYRDILKTVSNAWEKDNVNYNGMEVWYNGRETIEKKTIYALNHLGGVMIWEVSQDSNDEYSLQRTIGKTIEGSLK